MTEENEALHELIALVYLDAVCSDFYRSFFNITETTIETYRAFDHMLVRTGESNYLLFGYAYPCSTCFGELSNPELREIIMDLSDSLLDESVYSMIDIDIDSLDIDLLNRHVDTYRAIIELR